jgi:hypothetical protein
MKAPESFCVYGYCTALYSGPRDRAPLKLVSLSSNPVKIRYYDIVVYENAAITDTVVIDNFTKDDLLKDKPDLYAVSFTTQPSIHFKEKVFDDVSFIRDTITEAYFVNPALTIINKLEDHTYGTISGWGYFKIGIVQTKHIVKLKVDTKKPITIDPIVPEPLPEPPVTSASNSGCLPMLGAGLLSLLFPLFGLPLFASLIAFPLLLLLLWFLFKRSSSLTGFNQSFSTNSMMLSKVGCLWPATLSLLFSIFFLKVCNNLTNSQQRTSVIKEEQDRDRKIRQQKVLEQGEVVEIIPQNDNQNQSNSVLDSIIVLGKKVPIPYSENFQLLVYDYDKVDDDALSIAFNGESIIYPTSLKAKPIPLDINQMRSGNNYLDLEATSNGLSGVCTPRLVLTLKGKVLFNKTVGCQVGNLKRLTFSYN